MYEHPIGFTLLVDRDHHGDLQAHYQPAKHHFTSCQITNVL